MRPAVRTAERVTDIERHVADITERGYTVVHGVLAQQEVEEFLGDTQRLQRELPTVIANSTTIVKGFRRSSPCATSPTKTAGRASCPARIVGVRCRRRPTRTASRSKCRRAPP